MFESFAKVRYFSGIFFAVYFISFFIQTIYQYAQTHYTHGGLCSGCFVAVQRPLQFRILFPLCSFIACL
jgi:lipopolysaccharide export LptBFGC system permease protein LptF